ncbi:MAG: hypothetical protein J5781_03780 [Clostridia bacterium]|nr:hypothetical protein [Clostridia bacterium]
MHKRLSKTTRTAVSVTAVFISLLLAACWGVLAFITANTIRSYDYYGNSYTEIVSFSADYSDPRFTAAAFYAGDGKESDRVYDILDADKTPFVFVDKNSVDTEAFRKFFKKTRTDIVFCSENRETLEKLSREDRSFLYVWFVSSPVETFLASQMGYSCALPYEKITEKAINYAHKKNRLFAVYGVKNAEESAVCKKMGVDHVFVTDTYRSED